ncbi:hypothetical protein JCM24511_05609 [Saitozyma sp. JCM 24511]|nr:hypothetical protein JCM24511_05609 [Saitozyma sp. JCM 24511]
MRFAVPDSDSDDLVSLDLSYISDTSEEEYDDLPGPSERGGPRSHLGKTIRAYIDSSASESELEMNSEDEVDLLGGGWGIIRESKPKTKSNTWREPKSQTKLSSIRVKTRPLTPKTSWKGKAKAEPSISDLLLEELTEYDDWLKITEESVWREGQEQARDRRSALWEIKTNARAEMRENQGMKATREEEEMRRMIEAMDIRRHREDEERAQQFAEREKRLWENIDAAIREAERKEADANAAVLEAERRKKAEENAKIAAREKAVLAAKAEAERRVQEAAAQSRAKKDAEEAEQRRAAEAKRAEDANAAAKLRAADEKEQTAAEWRTRVEVQKRMKEEVIEPFKQGSVEGKAEIRKAMRLMTRGLGQVVNTKSSIVRVTEDIQGILNTYLPSPPTPASPTILEQRPPVAYCYLLSHLSKALIKQAEHEIAANTDAAFPLGRIVVGLLLRGHAAFGEVLFARLVKKCPWVVPYYPSRQPNQPREEYEKSTGRGSDESVSDYIIRMGGILTLYFSIVQTSLGSMVSSIAVAPTPDQLPVLIIPPLRVPAAWTWLSNMLRGPLISAPPAAHLLAIWIKVAGPEVIRVYGHRQVEKIMEAMYREGLEGGRIKGNAESERQKLGLAIEGWRD